VGHYKNQRILDQFGKKVKAIRELADLSQEQVQKATGISQSHLAQIESGKFNFRISYLALFAEFYGLEEAELLNYKSALPDSDDLKKRIEKYLKKQNIDPSLVLKKSVTKIIERYVLPSKFLNTPRSTKEIVDYIREKQKVKFTTTEVSRTLGILCQKGLLQKAPIKNGSKFEYKKL